MNWIAWLDLKLYPGFSKNWDDDYFRQNILSEMSVDSVVLDLGAGAGIVPQMNFKGIARHISGVDPDGRVIANPYLDDGRIGYGESIPWPDDHFDLVFSDNVLEHLSNPIEVFEEIQRVLKPGGIFLAKTPNKFHYVPLVARLTPLSFHKKVVSWRGRKGDDVFPTQYRANTANDIRKSADCAGLKLEKVDYIDGRPEYLRFSAITYLLGWLYGALVTNIPFFRYFRVILIVKLKKPV